MILSLIKQGSDEWYRARCGVVSASNFKLVLTKGSGKTRRAYMQRLEHEIITGQPEAPSFQSAAMARGTKLEPYARNAYQEETGNNVQEIGIAYLDENKHVAASPDGLISENGGLEIKCPLPHTHEKYLKEGCIPRAYIPQVQGSLWVTGRNWWDFMSYAPEFPATQRIMLHRVYRDESYIEQLSAEVLSFAEELHARVKNFNEKRHA